MTYQSLKASLHQLIDQIEDPILLAACYRILSAGKEGLNLTPGSLEVEEIRQGILEIEIGEVFPHEQVMREVNELLDLSWD